MEDNIEELLPFYALGTLTPQERAQVEAYLQANPQAVAMLEEMEQAALILPYAAPPVRATPFAESKLKKRIQSEKAAQRIAPAGDESRHLQRKRLILPLDRLAWPVAALSLAIALVCLVWALTLRGQTVQLGGEVTALQENLAAQRQVIADLQEQLLSQQQLIVQLSAPGLVTYEISGTDFQPEASGRLFVTPQSMTGGLILNGLAPLDTGSVYQLWLIEGDQPQSAGLFTVDTQGQATLLVEGEVPIDTYDAIGVSIEPEGGSEQPTGDIVLLSPLTTQG